MADSKTTLDAYRDQMSRIIGRLRSEEMQTLLEESDRYWLIALIESHSVMLNYDWFYMTAHLPKEVQNG
jgi:hypothetical protein